MTPDDISGGAVRIVRLCDLPDGAPYEDDLDEIFFTSSATKSFASEDARAAFKERWLGRYLTYDPQWFYLAFVGERVRGYLAGAIDDPAKAARFSDIGYFHRLAELTARYPAHLHVNVAEECRSDGIGSLLIERFVADLKAEGVPGVHLVTSKGSRNNRFYLRNGFTLLCEFPAGQIMNVMLGRTP